MAGLAESVPVWGGHRPALPIDARLRAEIVGRQPFGVFLRIADHSDNMGLAEVV
ncbi:hypothetical protein GCM10023223_28150 [Stackebrandtia albiflava]